MDIFYPPYRSNWIHVLWKYFLNYVFTKDMYKNLKEIEIIQDVKVDNFRESVTSEPHSSLH